MSCGLRGRFQGAMRTTAAVRSGVNARTIRNFDQQQQTKPKTSTTKKTPEDAELEARLAKLKAAKGATTDAEKREARAARQGASAAGAKPSPAAAAKPQYDFTGETVYWEGGPSNGDLAFNAALGATLVWLPLTFAAVGRRIFLKYKFTDRRLSVSDTFPTYGERLMSVWR